jgi:ATP-dependent RNA helicase A
LSPRKKSFAGIRSSNHVALLNAFYEWEDARSNGKQAEIRFCDSRGLSMPMLRVAWDAKVNKLKESLSREVEDIAY